MKQSTPYQNGEAIGLADFAATDDDNDADWVTLPKYPARAGRRF